MTEFYTVSDLAEAAFGRDQSVNQSRLKQLGPAPFDPAWRSGSFKIDPEWE